jgi:Flp pilus assembly protein TadD
LRRLAKRVIVSPRKAEIERTAMAFAAFVASAVLTQVIAPATPVGPATDYVDVAYEELAKGQTEQAIVRIRANPRIGSDDPAALINLGTAHARLGLTNEARDFFRAAIASQNRYDLQLADGRWMDSRHAARLALNMQSRGETLALR